MSFLGDEDTHTHTHTHSHDDPDHDREVEEEEEDWPVPGRARQRDRKHARRKPSPGEAPSAALLEGLRAEADGVERATETTYRPSRHEADWLLSSLQGFYDEGLITDVLFHIQGGKEASVYCCAADPRCGVERLAVKVYRPRKFRQLRNDQLYREGRETLSEEGRTIKQTKHRVMRAVQKRTAFGEQVRHISWLMYEYTALEQLWADGVSVPRPWSASQNAIAMDYIGDADRAAPPLSRLQLSPAEAAPLLQQVLRSVDLMLQRGLIHGDLSAYNLLYFEGRAVLIDFPQITRIGVNRHSHALFGRDIARVCAWFRGQGVPCDADAITEELWGRYVITHDIPVEADEDPP